MKKEERLERLKHRVREMEERGITEEKEYMDVEEEKKTEEAEVKEVPEREKEEKTEEASQEEAVESGKEANREETLELSEKVSEEEEKIELKENEDKGNEDKETELEQVKESEVSQTEESEESEEKEPEESEEKASEELTEKTVEESVKEPENDITENQKKRNTGKIIFRILTAAFMIAVIIGGVFLYNRYSYNNEPADMISYLNIQSNGAYGIILDNEIREENAKEFENTIYLDYEFVHEKLNPRIYWDKNEKLLLFTTPEELLETSINDKMQMMGLDQTAQERYIFHVEEDKVYISLPYIMDHTDIEYQIYQDPNYVYLSTSWEPYIQFEVEKDSAIRLRGGVKSPVVSEVQKGEQVRLVEAGENWSVVKKQNGLKGYIKNKDLTAQEEIVPSHEYQDVVYENISLDEPVVLAWHHVFKQEENDAIKQILPKTKNITVVAPTWFVLSDNEGNIQNIASETYVKYVHKMGKQVWALINNIDLETDLSQILSYTSKRKRLVSNIMEKLGEYDIDGINVDFEQVPQELADEYIEFLRELSIECRKQSRILSVDNYVPFSYNEYYNREEQGIIADYVVVMAYDEHYAGSEEGSVSSIGYVRDGIEKTIEEVPERKVICGIPFYTRVWMSDSEGTDSQAIGMGRQAEILKENHLTPTWLEDCGQNFVSYEKEGKTCKIWMEDQSSITRKMKVIRESSIAGVACWVLGFETEDIWDIISLD